jgi:type IV secretion system protein TrbL
VTTPLLAPAAMPTNIPLPNPFKNIPDPFSALGGAASHAAGSVATNLWTAAMLAIWNAGLFFFRLILNLMDAWLTPDLSTNGPAGSVYIYCFWTAQTLLVMFLIGQLGLAAFRRDARLLGRAAVGSAQFALVWCSWVGYCIALVAACGGLTRALLQALFGGARLSQIDLWQGFSTDSITSAVTATVLGFLGFFLILSSLAHLLVFLVRSASLIVLVLTSNISAAGLVAEFSRSWFWKTVRWIHAAALAPVLMVLVLGIGAKMTEGVATGLTDTTQQAIASAVPGVVLICMSAVCPFALFKLLAFVEPGTASGAAMRQGLAAQGGIQGVLSGNRPSTQTSSGAASITDEHGTSSGEDAAESVTGGRFSSVMKSALGPVGTSAGMANGLGAKALAMSTDLNNQAGVGHHSHYPDFTATGSSRKGNTTRQSSSGSEPEDLNPPEGPNTDDSRGPDGGGGPVIPPVQPPKASTPPNGGRPGGRGESGGPGGGGGAGGAGAGGGAEAAAVAV